MKNIVFLICIFIGFWHPQAAFIWGETLSERASNPITNLNQLQFENDFSPKILGSSECDNNVLIKPLIALDRMDGFSFEQLIRIKVPVTSLPTSSVTKTGTALGDAQLFDLFIKEESWGRWGVGPMAIFPTATKLDAGQGKWQIGPVFGMSILKFTDWQIGFLAQNPISFAGNPEKSHQNYLLFQPFIIYHFLKNSYFISNAEWTLDWVHHVQKIPINIGIGHTLPFINTFKLDTSIQFEWMAYLN